MSDTPLRALRMPEVLNRVGYKETALRKKIAEKQFPAPFKLGARAIAWLESDVNMWIADRAAGRAVSKVKRGKH
jgi:prophage regulatory protein